MPWCYAAVYTKERSAAALGLYARARAVVLLTILEDLNTMRSSLSCGGKLKHWEVETRELRE